MSSPVASWISASLHGFFNGKDMAGVAAALKGVAAAERKRRNIRR